MITFVARRKGEVKLVGYRMFSIPEDCSRDGAIGRFVYQSVDSESCVG